MWDGMGLVIVSHRSSKSTFGANKTPLTIRTIITTIRAGVWWWQVCLHGRIFSERLSCLLFRNQVHQSIMHVIHNQFWNKYALSFHPLQKLSCLLEEYHFGWATRPGKHQLKMNYCTLIIITVTFKVWMGVWGLDGLPELHGKSQNSNTCSL